MVSREHIGRRGRGSYEDLVGCVAERVKVDELFDLAGETQESGNHDVFKELGQCHHVATGLDGFCCRGPFRWRQRIRLAAELQDGGGDLPVIVRRVHEVVDLGVDQFKDAFLGRLLVPPEQLCRFQSHGPTCRGG